MRTSTTLHACAIRITFTWHRMLLTCTYTHRLKMVETKIEMKQWIFAEKYPHWKRASRTNSNSDNFIIISHLFFFSIRTEHYYVLPSNTKLTHCSPNDSIEYCIASITCGNCWLICSKLLAENRRFQFLTQTHTHTYKALAQLTPCIVFGWKIFSTRWLTARIVILHQTCYCRLHSAFFLFHYWSHNVRPKKENVDENEDLRQRNAERKRERKNNW